MSTVLFVFIIIFIVILVIYLFVASGSDGSVLTSESAGDETEITADMIYYLPAASVSVNATARVIATKDSSQNVVQARLQDITLDNTVTIVPDTSSTLCLNYRSNIFMNDELKVTAGPSGLLDTVTVTTDDHLSNILKLVGDTGGQLKPADFISSQPVAGPVLNTVLLTYNKVFHLMPDQLEKGSVCPWIIFTDTAGSDAGKVNAGFDIRFDREKKPEAQVVDEEPKNGLYTRPLTTLSFGIYFTDKKNEPLDGGKWEVSVPDVTRLVNVPLKRSAFVKRINTPKFASGLLTENYINEPSQFEGFISIPINIAKALVSIPAALFNFKIQKQTETKPGEVKKTVTTGPPQNGRPPGI
jgi:hypothetical protein